LPVDKRAERKEQTETRVKSKAGRRRRRKEEKTERRTREKKKRRKQGKTHTEKKRKARQANRTLGRQAEELAVLGHLLGLVVSVEDGSARVHFHEDAAEAPHVDRGVVAGAQNHLGRAVEAGLDVGVHLLVGEARGAKVDDLDARPLGVDHQDVFGLEVAVDHAAADAGEVLERVQQLASKLADELEGDADEALVLEQFVEVHGEEVEDQTLVAVVHEGVAKPH
jgi:hypothetical protein